MRGEKRQRALVVLCMVALACLLAWTSSRATEREGIRNAMNESYREFR